MKKTKLFGVLLFAGVLFSCSSDDNGNGNGGNNSEAILGKWYNKEYIVLGQTLPYDDHEDCGKDFVEFSPNKTGRFVDIWICEEFEDSFTYSISGNKLTVTADGETESARITELSNNTLKLKVTYDFDGNGTDEEVIEVYSRN